MTADSTVVPKAAMRVQKMPLQLVNSRAVKMVVMMVQMKDLMTAD